MRLCFAYRAALAAVAISLATGLAVLCGCSMQPFNSRGEPAPWRAAMDARCRASGAVRASAYVVPLPPINGPSACGIPYPLKVSGMVGGRVALTPPAKIDCAMTAALDRWVRGPVEQAAYRNFGQPVVAIKQIASYGCRSRDNRRGARISEHAFGNAIDIAGFTLANGHTITVLHGWRRGTPAERAFLREAYAGACATFYTVLGPGEPYHGNHFHLDLLLTNAEHGRHYCNPRPMRRGLFFSRMPMTLGPASDATGALPGLH